MIVQAVAVLIYAVYLFLPGYLVLAASRIYKNKFLLSYSISISIIVATTVSFRLIGGTIYLWIGILHVVIAFLVFGANALYKEKSIRKLVKHQTSSFERNRWPVFGCLGLLSIFSFYHLAVGPYTEIPSDFWKHLARVGTELHFLEEGDVAKLDGQRFGVSISSPIYLVHAIIARLLLVSPIDLIPPATLVTSGIFMGSVYWFSFKLLERFDLDARYSVAGALLAALLTLTSFGTASFSYVRYYAYFPTIFAFPLIYTSTVILLDYLEQPSRQIRKLILICLFLVVMTIIHRQEALLTFIILAGITFVRSARSLRPASGLSPILSMKARTSALFFFVLLTIIAVYALFFRELRPWGHTPHVIDAGQFFSPLADWPIDNPSFRFWDTLGFFGIIVYAWCIFKWKSLCRSDFLTAGMLTPLFTNLNPLYAWVYLHFGNSVGLWRTAYLIPLPMAAATLVILTFSSRTTSVTIDSRRILGLAMIALLALSQLPLNYQDTYNRTSKIPSLMPVDKKSGADLWKDLIDSVEDIQNKYPIRRIVTDEITTFVLYTATWGRIYWWPEHEYFPKHRGDYQEDFLSSDFNYSLLVINKRSGHQTSSARFSGHWPADVLDVTRHYPKNIDKFVAENPELFELMWSSGDINVYMMHSLDF
jgi:hypothetical protein